MMMVGFSENKLQARNNEMYMNGDQAFNVEDVNQNVINAGAHPELNNQYQVNAMDNNQVGGMLVYEQDNNQIQIRSDQQENVYSIVDNNGVQGNSFNQGICIEDTHANFMAMNQNAIN